MTSHSPSITPHQSIEDAFERFRRTVSADDARAFHSTTLRDVRAAARFIEQQLASRQELRNMRRIEPVLEGLERYSKAVEVLCNGTPYLPWIWVSIWPWLSNITGSLPRMTIGTNQTHAPGE